MVEEDVDSSSEEITTLKTYTSSEDIDLDHSNTTEVPEIIKICVNSTLDKSQPKKLQFVRNIVF